MAWLDLFCWHTHFPSTQAPNGFFRVVISESSTEAGAHPVLGSWELTGLPVQASQDRDFEPAICGGGMTVSSGGVSSQS